MGQESCGMWECQEKSIWAEPGVALSHCGSPEHSEPVIWEPPKLNTNQVQIFKLKCEKFVFLITFWTSSELVQWLAWSLGGNVRVEFLNPVCPWIHVPPGRSVPDSSTRALGVLERNPT